MSFEQWLVAFDQHATGAGLPWTSGDLPEADLRRRYLAGMQPADAVRSIQSEANRTYDVPIGPIGGYPLINMSMPPVNVFWLGLLCRICQVLAYIFWVAGLYLTLRHSDWLFHGQDAFDSAAQLFLQLGLVVALGAFWMFLAQMIPVWVRNGK